MDLVELEFPRSDICPRPCFSLPDTYQRRIDRSSLSASPYPPPLILLLPIGVDRSSPRPTPSIDPLGTSAPFSAAMGFVEDELKQLKDVISGLESRVKQLEQRTTGSSLVNEQVRMILIGPPGAGA